MITKRQTGAPLHLRNQLRSAAYAILMRIPYSFGNAALSFLCSQSWLQKTLFSRKLKPFNILFNQIKHEQPGLSDRAHHLICNFLPIWRVLALSHCTQAKFEKYAEFLGADHLHDAQKQGEGVILVNCHYGLTRCVPLALTRLGYNISSLESKDVFKSLNREKPSGLKVIEVGLGENFLLKQTVAARRVLFKKGLLHIVPDGLQGNSGKSINFFGKSKRFAEGFAQLATDTGAPVVPVVARPIDKNRLVIEFLPALQINNSKTTGQASIDHLCKQYVRLLSNLWRNSPASVQHRHIKHFLQLPHH